MWMGARMGRRRGGRAGRDGTIEEQGEDVVGVTKIVERASEGVEVIVCYGSYQHSREDRGNAAGEFDETYLHFYCEPLHRSQY